MEVFNECFDNDELSHSQKQSVITLFFKKGNKEELKNYRPISLSNIDYKIIGFTLANRLQNVIGKIISPDQTAYIKNRFIGQNIRLVSDVIEFSNEKNLDGVLLSLDYEKAFDTAEHKFLFECLQLYNFGPDFIKWIKTLYKKSEIYIKNNGYLSENIHPSRGVKQSCPISAMLFILIVETLAISIRNNKNIEGIQINHNGKKIDIKITQYADDTVIILKNIDMIKETMLELQKFAKVSGLNLNIDKTIGIRLGPNKYNTGTFQGIKITDKPFKYLGLYIGHKKTNCDTLNWNEKLLKAKKEIIKWNCRNLTVWGKIIVLKSLILSKFTNLMMNTTIEKDFLKQLEKISFQFIWGKRDKIRRAVAYSKICKGGLNMINLNLMCRSLKATWVKRILDGWEENWKIFARKYLSNYLKNNLLFYMRIRDIKIISCLEKLPPIYRSIVEAFISVHKCEDLDKNKIPLWGNNNITIFNKDKKINMSLFFESWINSGLIFLTDLKITSSELDELYIYEKLQHRTNYLCEILVIKKAIKTILKQNPNNIPTPRADNETDIPCNHTAKEFYNMGTEKDHIPTSETYWKFFFSNINNNLNFEDAYKQKILIIPDNKLKEFNFKLLHNILPCGTNLKRWKLKEISSCSICKENQDIIHMLYTCRQIRHIWQSLNDVLNVNIRPIHIICGHHSIPDFIITLISYIIYKEYIIGEMNNTDRVHTNMYHFISRELIYRYATFKHLHWFKGNIQKPFEIVLEHMSKHS